MPLKPQYHKQETLYSCAPACLKMVMEAYGVSVTEHEIREKCGCDEEGTDPEKLADAAREFGFDKSRAEQWGTDTQAGIEQVQKLLANGFYPIIYIKMPPPFPTHAVVVIALTEDKVQLFDPYHGPRNLAIERFLEEWTLTRQKIILVE